MYSGITAGLAARLVMGLVTGSTVNIVEVAAYAGALRAILAVLMVWFKAFLAFKRLARALI